MMVTLPQDPTAPRKKGALLKWVINYSAKNPAHAIVVPASFNAESTIIGTPARELLKEMQRRTGLPVSGHFDVATMRKLLPPGIRGEVMAIAHAELGTTEWPPGSNRGEVEKYLHSVGLGGGYPWCAAFATWVLHKAGFTHFPPGPASADSWGLWAKEKGLTKPKAQSLSGDLWVWEWTASTDGMYDHIGFVDEGIKGKVAFWVDGNVGANGGTVTDSSRYAGEIAVTIDLVRLHGLK
jgi:hypothetical protein